MKKTALILAAHGSREDPSVNARIRSFADRLAEVTPFDEVVAAFHQGRPSFKTVLDGLVAVDITVVPVMTSRGYYSERVVPRELARNRRSSRVRIRLLPPVGTHPAMVRLVSERIRQLARRYHLDLDTSAVAIVGHGTKRHDTSREATLELVEALKGDEVGPRVVPAFLDEEPNVESILARCRSAAVFVVPFLIGDGPHVRQDIPRRIGLDVPEGNVLPLCGEVSGRKVVYDCAVGCYPEIFDILAAMVEGQS